MTHTDEDIKFEKMVSQSILSSRQTVAIGEAGKTGAWRTVKPILINEKCIVVKSGKPTCHLCWMFCPEMTVSRTIPPIFNYDYCKGCGICARECPVNAIKMIPEKEKPSCKSDEGGN